MLHPSIPPFVTVSTYYFKVALLKKTSKILVIEDFENLQKIIIFEGLKIKKPSKIIIFEGLKIKNLQK